MDLHEHTDVTPLREATKRYARVGADRIAHLDQGQGPPVLPLHGCAFSSFAWRIVIAVHIAAGLAAVGCGAVAMLAPKRRGGHPQDGTVRLGALAKPVITAIGIAVARPYTADHAALGQGGP